MAIINCPKCHKYISSLLRICPECGCNVPEELALLQQQTSTLNKAEEQATFTHEPLADVNDHTVQVNSDATVIVEFDNDKRVDFEVSRKSAESSNSVQTEQPVIQQTEQGGVIPKVVKTVPGLHKNKLNSSSSPASTSSANTAVAKDDTPKQVSSDKQNNDASQQQKENKNKPGKKRMSLRRKITYYFVAFFVVSIISLYFIDRHRTASFEERAFAMLDSCEDLNWYEDYMIRFPDGPHINDVKRMYQEAKSDFADFIRIASHGSKTDVLAFLKSHPNTRFRHRCLNRIDSLDWRKAKSVNTLASYKKYLTDHAEGIGIFSVEAREAIDRITKQTVSDTDTEILTSTIKSFLSAMNSGSASRIDEMLSESFSFNGEGNVTGDAVVQYYNDKYLAIDEADNDVRFKLKDKPAMKRQKGAEDQEIFVVTATLVDANSKDTVDVDTWSLKMKFNSDRKLSEVTLK